ncbi:MAG: hypothetical protein KJO28_14045 [Desulfofustis sp.]|nr:hypothetical protein [Desulfofustis sp.]NNF45206.1 hypothetical protein [Desulfofustis sp.]
MVRLCVILITLFSISGCAPKPEPPPPRDYQFEALQNKVRQMEIFIDNWSGYEQEFSRINSLDEYRTFKNKIFSSPAYGKLEDSAQLEGKIRQFDAVIKRYEIWLEERTELLDQMEEFSRNYRDSQSQIFATHAKPFRVGPYELTVQNGYFTLEPEDPDKAYASARYVGLNQLNIIAASRDLPLRLPRLTVGDFIVEVKITNRSEKKILRPDGYIVHRQSRTLENGSNISRSYRQYLVNFSDEVQNRYQFAQAVDVTNKDSENGIRPGEHVVWSYRFNKDNHPVETVNSFKIIYPQKVFGKPLRLTIPLKTISKPTVPDLLRNSLS